MTSPRSVALLPEALYEKSRQYILRGLREKAVGTVDEYQLWASLAIELLGKAALAKVHPALIADPQDVSSLFAACGVGFSVNIKTTLEEWLGADKAKAPKEIVKHTEHAIVSAALVKLEQAKCRFEESHTKKQRDKLIAESDAFQDVEQASRFNPIADRIWPVKCPACSARAFLSGVLWSEDASQQSDYEDPWIEYIDRTYFAIELDCRICGLHFNNSTEITAAGVDGEFVETEEREREYEQDYGND